MRRSWYRVVLVLALVFVASFWRLVSGYAAEPRDAGTHQPTPAPASQTTSHQGPSIQIAEKTFDFGEVLEGSEVTHVFAVKNAGNGSLQITQVRPG